MSIAEIFLANGKLAEARRHKPAILIVPSKMNGCVNAVFAQKGGQRFGPPRVTPDHHQRATAKFSRERPGFAQRARAEDDARGGGKFKAWDHQF